MNLKTEIQNAITLFWEEDNEEKATNKIIEIFKEYHKQQLIVSDVLQQRELLNAFYDYIEKNVILGQNLPETDINDFLTNYCG